MKITESQLRKIIRQEILREDGQDASSGKKIKGGAVAATVAKKASENPALKALIDKISDANTLASYMQQMLDIAIEKGIDQKEVESAIAKLKSAVSSK